MTGIDVVIMAAGKGTRMKSRVPKVLHRLAGRPLLQHVLESAGALGARTVTVITGNGAADVESAAAKWAGGPAPAFVRQEPQLGTGHAVQQAAPHLPDDGLALILNGDVPLVAPATLQELVRACAVADRLVRSLRPRRRRGAAGARRAGPLVRAPGAAARHRPCGAAGHPGAGR